VGHFLNVVPGPFSSVSYMIKENQKTPIHSLNKL
jgi:hypothetical protein